MTLLEQAAIDAVRDYRLADKRTRGDRVGAVKSVRTICDVPVSVAIAAIRKAEETETRSWVSAARNRGGD